MLKILHLHNYYQMSGGEDTVFSAEVNLLRENGYSVIIYTDSNNRIKDLNPLDLAFQTIWSFSSYKKISDILQTEKPDIVHFHNTFPLISPAAYYACRKYKIPVIQSLDNPRLICPAATFYRNGNLCMDCLGKTPPYPGVIHRCYHNSPYQTSVIAAMLSIHRWIKTWQRQVDRYLVATEFYKQLFIKAGFPKEKIIVKPHFVQNNKLPKTTNFKGEYVLFIGRLDPEKGIRTLLRAWKDIDIPLKIRGEGKLMEESKDYLNSNQIKSISFLDRLSSVELDLLIQGARFLVWPSEGYYETFGMVAVECYAHGVPVIASNIGVMSEIVNDGVTGLLFKAGNASDLSSKIEWLWSHPDESARMGKNARMEYEAKYTPDRNNKMLMEIYSSAIADMIN